GTVRARPARGGGRGGRRGGGGAPGGHTHLFGVERREPGHDPIPGRVERFGAPERRPGAPRFRGRAERVHHGGGARQRLLSVASQAFGFLLRLPVLRDRAHVPAGRACQIARAQGALRGEQDGLRQDERGDVVLHGAGVAGALPGGEGRVPLRHERGVEGRRQRV